MCIRDRWLRAALVRAVRTTAQTAVATIGTTAVTIGDVNWLMVLDVYKRQEKDLLGG